MRDYDKSLDVDYGFKKTINEFVKISKHPIILSSSNEEFSDYNSHEFDLLNFVDYSLEEISLLLKIILEIEGNFRIFHSSNFFDEFFSLQNSCNSKGITPFTNEELFMKYLRKFENLAENFKILHNFEEIEEIVRFYNGNLSELFTKFEFLAKELREKPFFQGIKHKFFLENDCFEFSRRNLKKKIAFFPKELENRKIKEILPFFQQTEVFLKGNSKFFAKNMFYRILGFESVKNLMNIMDSCTNNCESLELYGKFLENCQNLDIFENFSKKRMKKNEGGESLGRNRKEEREVKLKSNDILGYLKPGSCNKEKNVEEGPFFVSFMSFLLFFSFFLLFFLLFFLVVFF